MKTPQTWADSLATTDDGKLFYSYLLVTGRELAAHAAAAAAFFATMVLSPSSAGFETALQFSAQARRTPS